MGPVRLVKTGDNYGLCNRLVPFAHLIASAAEYGWQIQNPGFCEFAEHFVGTADSVVPRFPGRRELMPKVAARLRQRAFQLTGRLKAKFGLEDRIVLGDHDLCDLSAPSVHEQLQMRGTSQCIGLYFYNNVAVPKHIGLIREFFAPIPSIADDASRTVEVARASGDVLVGVHIRHGDYRTFCDGAMFYTFDQYADLMRTFQSECAPGHQVRFLISSNVVVPPDTFAEFRYTVAAGHFVADVYALAQCDYILGPPSTFSEWASFYGNVPRYVHLANDYRRNGLPWPGMRLCDFVAHRTGFARCNPGHPATLIR